MCALKDDWAPLGVINTVDNGVKNLMWLIWFKVTGMDLLNIIFSILLFMFTFLFGGMAIHFLNGDAHWHFSTSIKLISCMKKFLFLSGRAS